MNTSVHNSSVVISSRLVVSTTREKIFCGVFLLLFTLIAVFDLMEDIWEGEAVLHLVMEGSFFLGMFCTVYFLWQGAKRLRKETGSLQSELRLLHQDRNFWQEEASNYLRGLGTAIDLQFTRWNLTLAEKDIALLLLKGFSHKEIAQLRVTSDRTIRQQAASIYRKANLDGRAQLAAFFLEDLLLPSKQPSLELS